MNKQHKDRLNKFLYFKFIRRMSILHLFSLLLFNFFTSLVAAANAKKHGKIYPIHTCRYY